MTKLRAMFVVIGVALTGGTLYSLAMLKAEYAPADAVDAGLLTVSVPARLSCRVRVLDECRQGPNAGRPKYARVGLKARLLPSANPDTVAFDVPDAWRECLRIVGTPLEACDVVENGACTLPAVCGAGAQPQFETDACACRPAAGVCTRADGGVAPFGVTLAAGEWTGAGCVRKFCGPEIAGEQGGSWPTECPQ